MKRRSQRWILLMCAGCLPACGTLHLYDKGADKLASEARTAYDGSQIALALKGEQGSFDAIEQKELAASSNVVTAQRDLALLAIMSDAKEPFVARFGQQIDARIGAIIVNAAERGQPPDFAAALALSGRGTAGQANLERLRAQDARQRAWLIEQNPEFASLAACDAAHAERFKADDRAALGRAVNQPAFDPPPWTLRAYQQYVASCQALLRAQAEMSQPSKEVARIVTDAGSELGRAIAQADARAAALKLNRSEVAAAKRALSAATRAVLDARQARADAAPARTPGCAGRQGAQDDMAEVCALLKKLRELGDEGVKLVSEEQIKQVDLLLAALSGSAGKQELRDMPQALLLLHAALGLADALDGAPAAPALEPLLLAKQLFAARLDAATRGAAIEQSRVELAREKVDALRLELDLLLRARKQLDDLKQRASDCHARGGRHCPAVLDVPLSRLIGDQRPATRDGEPAQRGAYRALALYADSFSVARAAAERAEQRLAMLDYREAHMRSQAALMSWDALIATPLAQLQAYHAGGVRQEDLAQLLVQALQAAGVIGIATK